MQMGFQAIPSSQRSSKQKLKEIDGRLLLHGQAEARIEHILIRQGSPETELIPPPLTSGLPAPSVHIRCPTREVRDWMGLRCEREA